jgi:hypothetical protein
MFKNKMKIWGIVASVLSVVFIVTTVFFYVQYDDLKNKNNALSTDLTTVQSEKNTSDEQFTDIKTNARKKLEILDALSGDNMTQEEQFHVYSLIQAVDNATLTADWKATLDNEQGDDSNDNGQKLMKDLISETLKDLQ